MLKYLSLVIKILSIWENQGTRSSVDMPVTAKAIVFADALECYFLLRSLLK